MATQYNDLGPDPFADNSDPFVEDLGPDPFEDTPEPSKLKSGHEIYNSIPSLFGGSALGGFAKGLVSPITAAGQMASYGMSKLPGSIGELGKEGLQDWNAVERGYQQEKEAAGRHGADVAETAGELLSPLSWAAGTKAFQVGGKILPKITNKAARAAIQSSAGGAAVSALTPVENSEDFGVEKLKQEAIGAGTAALGTPIIYGASRAISPKLSQSKELALLRKENISPTIGQTIGGAIGGMEEKLKSLPWTGDVIESARKRSFNDLNTAAFNRALNPIGEKLPEGLKGYDAVAHTNETLSKKYKNVLDSIGPIKPDDKFNSKINELKSFVDVLKIPQSEKDKFSMILDNINSSIDEHGNITSEAYKQLESSLSNDASFLGRSQNIYENKLSSAVYQLKENLKDMLKRQAGDKAEELSKVNKGWANFKRIQKAAGSVGAEDGEFNPSQLHSAVKSFDKSKDKARFSEGKALMQDLSSAGKKILGNKIPDSGTAGRTRATGLISEGVGLAGSIPAYVFYSKPVQNALVSAVSKRGSSAPLLAERLNYLTQNPEIAIGGNNVGVPVSSLIGSIPNRVNNQ